MTDSEALATIKNAITTWWVIVLLIVGLGCICASIPLWQIFPASESAQYKQWLAAQPSVCIT